MFVHRGTRKASDLACHAPDRWADARLHFLCTKLRRTPAILPFSAARETEPGKPRKIPKGSPEFAHPPAFRVHKIAKNPARKDLPISPLCRTKRAFAVFSIAGGNARLLPFSVRNLPFRAQIPAREGGRVIPAKNARKTASRGKNAKGQSVEKIAKSAIFPRPIFGQFSAKSLSKLKTGVC